MPATFMRRFAQVIRPKTLLEWVVVCFAIGLLGSLLFDSVRNEFATRRGRADAAADLARGEFHYKLRGLARGWEKNAVAIAQRDYGIRIVRTGGCTCSGSACSYDQAYNRVVHDHFVQIYGYDPLNRTFEQARREFHASFDQ